MERIEITELDHIVLNVADIERSLQFYTEVMGLKPERLEAFRTGKAGFPSVRISPGTIIDLFPTKDPAATDGGGEKIKRNLNHFCLVVGKDNFSGMVDFLARRQIAILEGPVSRWGARGQATSVYFHDPDGNVIEIRCY